jgi:hypothetical protein
MRVIKMGEWSEFFEDFPEEDQGNYVNGVFDPELARRRHPDNYVSNYVSPKEAQLRKEQHEILMRLKGIDTKK